MQHKLLFSAIALALSYSAQAVIVPEGTQLDEKQHIVINNGAEPQSFDPQKTEGVPESSVAYQLLEGLVTSDSEGKLQPGVAESWENTPDLKLGHSIYVKMPNGQMVIPLPRTISCLLGVV